MVGILQSLIYNRYISNRRAIVEGYKNILEGVDMNLLQLLISIVLASVHYVPTDYTLIQTAIDASEDGDSIMVLPGYYDGFNYGGKNVHVESTQGPDSTYIYGYIRFTNGEGRDAVLKGFNVHGPIDYYEIPIEAEGADPSIVDNVFESYYWSYTGVMLQDSKNGGIIKLTNSSALIEGNQFLNNSIYWDSCWLCDGYSILKGLCIYIHQDQPTSMVEIRNNSFTNNHIQSYAVYTYGLCIYIDGDAFLSNNIFYCNGLVSGFYACIATAVCIDNESDVVIENTVFCYNLNQTNNAVAVLDQSECDIANCIVRSNMLSQTGGSFIAVEYSNVEGGYAGTGNIDSDPQFCTGLLSEYHLDPGSPCVDAGNPDQIFYDPEDSSKPGYAAWPSLGTVTNDMGVYGGSGVAYWSQGGTEIELSEHVGIQLSPVRLLSVIPNPVQSTAMIEFTLAESCLARLKIYDITGRVVYQQENQYLNGANEIICPDLENGFYCSRIEVSNFSATRSFLVLR